MTLFQLSKVLGELIRDGHGRLPVCVDKSTFRHNLEADGCVILDVHGLVVERVLIADDDGGTKLTKAGREVSRSMVVLLGSAVRR